MPLSSRIENFYNLSIEERKAKLVALLDLSPEDLKTLEGANLSDEILFENRPISFRLLKL